MKTMTLWDVPVDLVPAVIDLMNQKACALILENRYEEANSVLYDVKRAKEMYDDLVKPATDEE